MLTEDIIVKLANLYKVTPNVILNYKSKNEIDDIKIIKLLKLIKKENIDVEQLIALIKIIKKI